MVCSVTSVVDTAIQKIEGRISGANGAAGAVSPKGNVVYISTGGATIDIVDPLTDQVTGTIPIVANAIAFSPDGAKAYVESIQNGQSGVAEVDTSTLAVTGFVPGITAFPACGPHGCSGNGAGGSLAVAPDGRFVYAAGTPGAVIDAQTLTIVNQFTAGGPIAIH
jgi:DNA-binding beta-propeller fold protein YncE